MSANRRLSEMSPDEIFSAVRSGKFDVFPIPDGTAGAWFLDESARLRTAFPEDSEDAVADGEVRLLVVLAGLADSEGVAVVPTWDLTRLARLDSREVAAGFSRLRWRGSIRSTRRLSEPGQPRVDSVALASWPPTSRDHDPGRGALLMRVRETSGRADGRPSTPAHQPDDRDG